MREREDVRTMPDGVLHDVSARVRSVVSRLSRVSHSAAGAVTLVMAKDVGSSIAAMSFPRQ